MTDTDDPPPLRVVLRHRTARRARLCYDRNDAPVDLQALADRLARLPGLDSAVIRPGTGSIVLRGRAPISETLDTAEAEGIVKIATPGKPPPVAQVVQFGFLRADQTVRSRTGDALELRTAMALILIFAAIVQLGRGRIAGPATTLLMSALALLDLPKR